MSQPEKWREETGVIYFTVTSDGTTGPGWIKRLKKKGCRLSRRAKDVLGSLDFKPTNGVTTEIAILKGELFSDDNRVTHIIRSEAKGRKLKTPSVEVACLIREMFVDEEIKAMGLCGIETFHKAINDSTGGLSLLSAERGGDGGWLNTYDGYLGSGWCSDHGFAFEVLQR